MSFPFYIARRYLFTRKSHHVINVISAVSVLGVAVATMALVCTLSVFNGFHQLVASLFTAFDPMLKIVPAEGKTFSVEENNLVRVKQLDCVEAASFTLEDHALARYNGRQMMVKLKGVDDDFSRSTDIFHILYGKGMFRLHADVLEYGVPGIRLATSLGMDASYIDPLVIYTPTAGARMNMMAPDENFNIGELNSPGVVFSVGQKKYDQEYIICSLGFAQQMFEKAGKASSMEIKIKREISLNKAKEEIRKLVGEDFRVIDRYEQQEDVFRVMKIEKYMAYIFLTFILLIACFNIVGSLGMLIVDKKDDITSLRNLGATNKQVRSIFLLEGRLISIAGAVIGIVVGLFLCLMQQNYGLLKLGDKAGAFIVEAYPVAVDAMDVLLVFITVVVVSFAVSWYPVHFISKRLLQER